MVKEIAADLELDFHWIFRVPNVRNLPFAVEGERLKSSWVKE